MSNFNKYSKYYDLFYEDKDYTNEVKFLLSLAKKNNIDTESILDLGCGTGMHAIDFALNGSNVHGIDLSEPMLEKANALKDSLNEKISTKITYSQGDIRNFKLDTKFDIVFSLFHVVSYLQNNDDTLNAFKSIYDHLNDGGIFIFDYWYGPGVLWQRPSIRSKEIKKDKYIITRDATPVMHFNQSIVDVNYEINIKDTEGNLIDRVKELHEMRYLFKNEIDLLARIAGLQLIESGEWLTANSLSQDCWTAYSILKK